MAKEISRLRWLILTWILINGVIFLSSGSLYAQTDTLTGTGEWKVEKSRHFIIHYKEAPKDYVNETVKHAERYYKSITEYLGYRRFNFWTFDKRCKIYLYNNRQQYLKTTNTESWSRGKVHVIRKEIVAYVGREEFFDHVLPHEMGHIIFREMVGFNRKLPLWIDEGVALLQEKDREKYLTTAESLVRNKIYLSLKTLSDIKDYKLVIPLIFYSESASIMEFLLEEFGRDRFVTFCRRLRDKEEWSDALLRTYRFDNLEGLEQAWVNGLLDSKEQDEQRK